MHPRLPRPHRLALFCGLLLILPKPSLGQDTMVVRSSGPGRWGGSIRLVEELRIGMLDGPDHYVFGDIDGIAVGLNGTIYVADGQVPVVRAYDASGEYLRDVGQLGDGPGEYRELNAIRTLRDGRLVVRDTRGARVIFYDPAGEYLSTIRLATGFYTANPFAVDTLGNVYVKDVDPGLLARGEEPLVEWIKVSPTGEVPDTIPIPLERSDPSPSFVLAGPGGYLRPFTRQTVSALSPHGYLVTGRNESYSFTLRRGPGQPPLRVEREYRPIPVEGEEREEWEGWIAFFLGRGSEVSDELPETKPAYRDLEVDDDGRIWVTRYVEAEERPDPEREPGDDRPRKMWREPRTFDVFAPDGTFLGTIVAPERVYFDVARGMRLWGRALGEFDEEYVVRYRIEVGPSG